MIGTHCLRPLVLFLSLTSSVWCGLAAVTPTRAGQAASSERSGTRSPVFYRLSQTAAGVARVQRRLGGAPPPGASTQASSIKGKDSVKAIVGVFSGISRDYFVRRQAVRAAWVPESEAAILQLRQLRGVVVRFVVGFSPNEEAMKVLEEEAGLYGDMIRLNVLEKYHNLVLKMRRYMQYAAEHYNFDYLLKVDDDVYHNPHRLSFVTEEWKRLGADYVGCFLWNTKSFKPITSKWFEPNAPLVGDTFYTYPGGPTYALSEEAVRRVNHIPDGWLRFYGCGDDCSVASWLLALNVTYRDDRRLCATACHPAALTVRDGPGLIDPQAQLPALHSDPLCSSQGDPAAAAAAAESLPPLPLRPNHPEFDFSNTNCYKLATASDASFDDCVANHREDSHPMRNRRPSPKAPGGGGGGGTGGSSRPRPRIHLSAAAAAGGPSAATA